MGVLSVVFKVKGFPQAMPFLLPLSACACPSSSALFCFVLFVLLHAHVCFEKRKWLQSWYKGFGKENMGRGKEFRVISLRQR